MNNRKRVNNIIKEIGSPIKLINIALIQLELADKVEIKGSMVSLKLT